MEAPAFADMIIDSFEEMLPDVREAPLVMGVALHPHVVDQPYRLRHLRRALTYIRSRASEIWITRAGDIAKAYAARVELNGDAPAGSGRQTLTPPADRSGS